jgi:cell division protein FtsW (lipid II flippase)
MNKIRHYENLHIPLWLMKDTCWMLQWRILGMIMIIPTLTVAIILAVKSYREKDDEFWINFAICFWISANSYWMICEFFHHEEIKNYAGIPFVCGMLCVLVFYVKRIFGDKNKNIID